MSSDRNGSKLSRDLFSDKDFCAIQLLNTLTNRVLYRYSSDNNSLKKPATGSCGGRMTSPSGNKDYLTIASELATVHEAAKQDILALLRDEQILCANHETTTRSSEIEEKTLLSGVRVGLEETSRKLWEMEDCLANAAAATVGIEQHLAQASARVTRGKATCTLHRHFVNMCAVNPSELDDIMANLSTTRREQRQQKTEQWLQEGVSDTNHYYFSYVNREDVGLDGSCYGDRLSCFSEDMSDESDDGSQGGQDLGTSMYSYHSETFAVTAGLGRVFVCWNRTEAAVAWIGRLVPLACKLSDLFPKASSNIALFSSWLQQELILDFFHLTENFYALYEKDEGGSVSCSLGKTILRAISLVAELHSTLTGSPDGMVVEFLKHTQCIIQGAIDTELKLTPLPPLVPLTDSCDSLDCNVFYSHTVHEIEVISEYLVVTARKAVIIMGAISNANATGGKQQVVATVVNMGLIPFVTITLDSAFERAADVLRQEGRLSPCSRRSTALRVADTISYSLNMLCCLFTTSIGLSGRIFDVLDASTCGALIAPIEQCFEQRRCVYATDRLEVSLINRYLSLVEDEYVDNLGSTTTTGGHFDYRPAHTQKMKDIVAHTEKCLKRCVSLACSSDMEELLKDITMNVFTGVGNFLSVELKNVYESCKKDAVNWRKYRKTPDEYLVNAKQESHICAMRVLLWAQTSILSVSECFVKVCAPVIPQHPRLVTIFENCKIKTMQECDKRSEELLNIVMHAIIVRSLNLLVHLQEKYDYRPKGDVAKRDQGCCVSYENTVACITFCKYLAVQLNEAKTFIRLSSRPLPSVDAAQECTLSVDGGLSTSLQIPSFPSSVPKSSVKVTEENVVAKLTLHQMIYPDVPTFARVLGASLYKGLSAHLKGYLVNDAGSLIFKKDTALYRSTIQPLVEVGGLDGVIVGALFDILKESSNLLIVPLDNISAVKESGRLALLSNAEKVCFLKMRLDLKDAFHKTHN